MVCSTASFSFVKGFSVDVVFVIDQCRLGNMTTNNTGDLRSAGVVQVLDVGCGVASFSAYLLPLDIQTMSFAPKDGHENQIQFALERGIGAMISVLATKQLPYPESSFEMVHCSRCRVDWHENGKIHISVCPKLLTQKILSICPKLLTPKYSIKSLKLNCSQLKFLYSLMVNSFLRKLLLIIFSLQILLSRYIIQNLIDHPHP
jgi:hypothetical protein